MRTTVIVPLLLLGALSLLVSAAVAQDQDAARLAASKELRAGEKEIDKLYSKCLTCRGRGKQGDKRCHDCLGTGKTFQGDYQGFIDQYVAYCDLMTKHAGPLADDEKFGDRCREKRACYLRSVRAQIGPQSTRQRLNHGGTAEYSRGRTLDGECNKLASELIRATRESPVGRGIAFSGKVVRLLTKDKQSLAEVRIETVSGYARTCFVLVPPDVKWAEEQQVQVVGRLTAGAAEQKAFDLPENTPVIASCHGTE